MALFKQESPEEIQARIDKHNGTVGWTEEQREADRVATAKRLTDTRESLALEEIQAITTRAQAKAAGDLCMAQAKATYDDSAERIITRIDMANLRYDKALWWQSRALSYYQLAALLPESG